MFCCLRNTHLLLCLALIITTSPCHLYFTPPFAAPLPSPVHSRLPLQVIQGGSDGPLRFSGWLTTYLLVTVTLPVHR